MSKYRLPEIIEAESVAENIAILVASGDLRLSANQSCWPAQQDMEKKLADA